MVHIAKLNAVYVYTCYRVIPYQFSKSSHVTSLKLCVLVALVVALVVT